MNAVNTKDAVIIGISAVDVLIKRILKKYWYIARMMLAWHVHASEILL